MKRIKKNSSKLILILIIFLLASCSKNIDKNANNNQFKQNNYKQKIPQKPGKSNKIESINDLNRDENRVIADFSSKKKIKKSLKKLINSLEKVNNFDYFYFEIINGDPNNKIDSPMTYNNIAGFGYYKNNMNSNFAVGGAATSPLESSWNLENNPNYKAECFFINNDINCDKISNDNSYDYGIDKKKIKNFLNKIYNQYDIYTTKNYKLHGIQFVTINNGDNEVFLNKNLDVYIIRRKLFDKDRQTDRNFTYIFSRWNNNVIVNQAWEKEILNTISR